MLETHQENYSRREKKEITSISVNDKKICGGAAVGESAETYEIILPEGRHKVTAEVKTGEGKDELVFKDIDVKNNYFFLAAPGDGKAGYTFHKGDAEPVRHDDKFNESFWSEGKPAYYLKGKIPGKILITSSLDTGRNQKELFRNLDPDKYYPVYGDGSEIDYKAADTHGVLYALLEWDKSSFNKGQL